MPCQRKPRVRLRHLAEERRRWGYRRLHILLERKGWQVNSKRVYPKTTGDVYVQMIEASVLTAMNSRTVDILADWKPAILDGKVTAINGVAPKRRTVKVETQLDQVDGMRISGRPPRQTTATTAGAVVEQSRRGHSVGVPGLC